jgi:hypothetical protein
VSQLANWRDNHQIMLIKAQNNYSLRDWLKASEILMELSILGLESIEKKKHPNDIDATWTSTGNLKLKIAKKPVQESELVIIESINMLFQNALPK